MDVFLPISFRDFHLQGERVEHEGFLDGDLLKRFLMMPEEKQQAPADKKTPYLTTVFADSTAFNDSGIHLTKLAYIAHVE